MEYVDKFYGHLVYFAAIWYILWSSGIFFPVLVCCSKKNLATLLPIANGLALWFPNVKFRLD
jgi:hypothetical protein